MAFSDQFKSYFTEEEQETTLFKIVNQIGQNTELAILEDLSIQLLKSSDINSFTSDQVKSWLSGMLYKVPSYTSASGTIYITFSSVPTTVTIPKGKKLVSNNGVSFITTSSLTVAPGSVNTPYPITVKQGVLNTVTGSYKSFIKISASNVDLDTLKVSLKTTNTSDLEIPPVGYKQSTAIPQGGYYAFAYNGYLYIRIFKGQLTSTSINVPDPEGVDYVVSFLQSEGVYGNIPANQIASFEESLGEGVEYTITQDSFINGANEPETFELINTLRNTFYVKESVSSIPEYEAWLKKQPGISDCIVEGDYARSIRMEVAEPSITGSVYITCLGSNSKPITGDQFEELYQPSLEQVKDIGFIQYVTPEEDLVFFIVRYFSSTNDYAFEALIRSTIAQWFEVNYVASQASSLFASLDVSVIMKSLLESSYSPQGLDIQPYRFFSKEPTGTSLVFSEVSYRDTDYTENYYFSYIKDPDTGKYSGKTKYIEVLETDNKYAIIDVSTRKPIGYRVVSQDTSTVSVSLPSNSVFEGYLGMTFPGKYLISSTSESNVYYRKLASTVDNKEGIQIEKREESN